MSGKEEGREEGREEGKKERNIEIAKEMKKSKISTQLIEKITGLAKETIEKIK